MDPRLTKEEILDATAGAAAIPVAHRKVADAQLRKALWWAAAHTPDKFNQQWFEGTLREMGIEPWEAPDA